MRFLKASTRGYRRNTTRNLIGSAAEVRDAGLIGSAAEVRDAGLIGSAAEVRDAGLIGSAV